MLIYTLSTGFNLKSDYLDNANWLELEINHILRV